MDPEISPLDSCTNDNYHTYCSNFEIYWNGRRTPTYPNRTTSIDFDAAAGNQWILFIPDPLFHQMGAQSEKKYQQQAREQLESWKSFHKGYHENCR